MVLPLIGPEKDIPAPDVNTNAETMGLIMDTYSMLKGYTVPGVVTGKPVEIGGSLGRSEATGRGVMITAMQLMKKLGMQPENTRAAVQGFGNVGSAAADLLAKQGVKICALSDVSGGIYCADGLDVSKVRAFIAAEKGRFLKDYTIDDVCHITNEERLKPMSIF